MNLFYNATTGFDACYKPNLVTYKTGIKNAEPANFRIKDDIVLQKDFYDSRHRTEYPKQYLPNPNPGPKTVGTNTVYTYFQSITEFDFELAGYTNVKNIMVQFKVDLWNTDLPARGENLGILQFNQNAYAFLDYIQRVECYIGSNKIPINTDMMDLLSIKRYISSMDTTYQENIILGELGFDIPMAQNPQNTQSAPFDFNPGNTARVVQNKVWQEINTELMYRYFKQGNMNINNFNLSDRIVTVPLYMLVPFFRQDQVWLPKGFPINLKITWNTDPSAEYFAANNSLVIPYTFGIQDPNTSTDCLNFILSPTYSPRIRYLYSRLTNDDDIKAYTSVQNMKFNFFSYIRKNYSLGTLPVKIASGNNRRIYTLLFPNPVSVRPLAIMIGANFIKPPKITDFAGQFFMVYRMYSDINFLVYNFEEQQNGMTIKRFNNTFSDAIEAEIKQNRLLALRIGGTDSETCMNSEDYEMNNSDDIKDDYVSFLSSGYNYLRGSTFNYCSAPGNMYSRQLQPLRDGVSQYAYNIEFGVFVEPESTSSKIYDLIQITEISVYFKNLTQVIMDQNFNITMIDLPAISI